MTIRKLKELIANFPDDMRIYDDNNVEFVKVVRSTFEEDECVMQTRRDVEPNYEVKMMRRRMEENFWKSFHELGYTYTDFADSKAREEAKKNLTDYGLI